MKQSNTVGKGHEDGEKFEQWCFQQTVEIEHRKQQVSDQEEQLENDRKKFEKEKSAFQREQEIKEAKWKQEQHLFDMRLKILESELQKMAAEKQQLQRQKEFFSKVNEYENDHMKNYQANKKVVGGDMFFVGVTNILKLKKRYKDLIKIYHPDNMDGDTSTLQEINREYDKLKKKMEAS